MVRDQKENLFQLPNIFWLLSLARSKDEIEKKVTDGTWMVMRPFPKSELEDLGLPTALTDKQFGA